MGRGRGVQGRSTFNGQELAKSFKIAECSPPRPRGSRALGPGLPERRAAPPFGPKRKLSGPRLHLTPHRPTTPPHARLAACPAPARPLHSVLAKGQGSPGWAAACFGPCTGAALTGLVSASVRWELGVSFIRILGEAPLGPRRPALVACCLPGTAQLLHSVVLSTPRRPQQNPQTDICTKKSKQ